MRILSTIYGKHFLLIISLFVLKKIRSVLTQKEQIGRFQIQIPQGSCLDLGTQPHYATLYNPWAQPWLSDSQLVDKKCTGKVFF